MVSTSEGTKTVYAIDAAHTLVEFAVKHMMVSTAKGRANVSGGEIVIDSANAANSSVKVTIDATSIKTGDDKRDAHLQSADFFETEKYPEITFVSTKVTPASGDDLMVEGDLTIHGVTKPVVLDVTYNGTGTSPWGQTVVGYSATAKINREDWGLTWNAALETGGVIVSKDVKLSLEVEGIKQ